MAINKTKEVKMKNRPIRLFVVVVVILDLDLVTFNEINLCIKHSVFKDNEAHLTTPTPG